MQILPLFVCVFFQKNQFIWLSWSHLTFLSHYTFQSLSFQLRMTSSFKFILLQSLTFAQFSPLVYLFTQERLKNIAEHNRQNSVGKRGINCRYYMLPFDPYPTQREMDLICQVRYTINFTRVTETLNFHTKLKLQQVVVPTTV